MTATPVFNPVKIIGMFVICHALYGEDSVTCEVTVLTDRYVRGRDTYKIGLHWWTFASLSAKDLERKIEVLFKQVGLPCEYPTPKSVLDMIARAPKYPLIKTREEYERRFAEEKEKANP